MNRRRYPVDPLALLACLVLALAVRLPGLAAFLTADEARSWFGRSIIFLDALDRGNWANTAPGSSIPTLANISLSPAPGVTTMWTGALGILLAYWQQGAPGSLAEFLRTIPFDPLDPAMLPLLRLPGVLVAVAAIGLTYWWSRPLLGRGGAFLAAGLLALDPFSLALSRVLGHDALVATFMWLSLLAFLRMADGEFKIQNSKFSIFLLLSGALAGLAFLSKYPALFMGAFIGLALLLLYLGRSPGQVRLAVGRWLRDMLLWTAAAVLVYVVAWPAAWVNPVGPVLTIVQDALRASGGAHPKGSFFLGQPVPDPGLLFYPLVALLRTTPVVLVGLVLALWPRSESAKQRSSEAARQRVGEGRITENRPHVPRLTPHASRLTHHLPLILWAYVILYTLLVTYGGKKQDRYLLPAFPALVMLATIGYLRIYDLRPAAIYDLMRRLFWKHSVLDGPRTTHHAPRSTLLALLLLLIQALFVLPSYPYYFSYYNPLLGGGPAAARWVQVGWGEGLNEAAAYLNTLPGAESLRAVAWYSTTFEPYFKGWTIYKIDEEKISRSPKPGLAADYVILYVNQLQRRLPSEGGLAYFQQHPPVHTVVLGGQPYAWIYPAPGVAHLFAGEARLVGQAELLGYDWLDEAGRRLETVPSGSVPTLRLYWEWQGKAPADPIRLSLVDAADYTWGWAAPVDAETALPACPAGGELPCPPDGTIVVSDYAVALRPGTPPGTYALKAWIERPETGETIGQFPLVGTDATVTVGRPLTPAAPEDIELASRLEKVSLGPLRLLGYDLSRQTWEPGQPQRLELAWAWPADGQPAPTALPDLEVELSLTPSLPSSPPPPSSLPSWRHPVTPAYPTSRWQPGDHFRDVWVLPVPASTPRGRYDLLLRLGDDLIRLGSVEVGGRERLFTLPSIATPFPAVFGNSIKLLGYELRPPTAAGRPPVREQGVEVQSPASAQAPSNLQPPTSNLQPPTFHLPPLQSSNPLSLTLFWQALVTPPEDYTVFVQLLDAKQQIVAQQDSPPQAGAAPTSTWAVGEIVPDEYTLVPARPLDRGPYRLVIGLYRPTTGERLSLDSREGETDALTLAVLEAIP